MKDEGGGAGRARGVTRRAFAAGVPLIAASLCAPSIEALRVKPRSRVIIDNDFSADPDGLFQLAHHLAAPSTIVPLVIGSHTHPNDFLDRSATQADNAVRCVHDIADLMRLDRIPAIIAGRNQLPMALMSPGPSAAARRIVAEAMRTDTDLPLFYAAGAGLTELAAALRLEPRVAGRMKLVWIGGPEHPEARPGVSARTDGEYNLTIDLHAVQTVFNESALEIWQVPRDAYRTMLISHAELEAGLKPAGRLGEYLLAQLDRAIDVAGGLGETYILGDSPLVTLTALQSSFDADSSSSDYVVQPTPSITNQGWYGAPSDGRPMRVYRTIDARLTFADMFARLAANAR